MTTAYYSIPMSVQDDNKRPDKSEVGMEDDRLTKASTQDQVRPSQSWKTSFEYNSFLENWPSRSVGGARWDMASGFNNSGLTVYYSA